MIITILVIISMFCFIFLHRLHLLNKRHDVIKVQAPLKLEQDGVKAFSFYLWGPNTIKLENAN